MRHKLATAATAVAFAALSVGSAAATDLYAKPGGTAAAQAALLEDCRKLAANASYDSTSPYSTYNANGYAFMASSFASGVINGMRKAKAEARVLDQCMRKDGWARIALTREEAAAYDKTSGEARNAWLDDFLRSEAAVRVQAALAPKAPKLPSEGFEPAVGAVRFDPAALTAAQGPVPAGGALLAGKVTHRLTATLREDVAFGYGAHGAKGEVYHLVDFRPPDVAFDDPQSSYWCADVPVTFGTRPQCLWSEEDGYHFGLIESVSKVTKTPAVRPWLIATPEFAPKMSRTIKGPVLLDVSQTDLVGPMDFSLRIEKADEVGLQLAAVAHRDGADLVFWNCFVRFDQSGKAVVPMWTHRLTVTRSGAAFASVYTADGDGRGLGDLPEFKSPQGF